MRKKARQGKNCHRRSLGGCFQQGKLRRKATVLAGQSARQRDELPIPGSHHQLYQGSFSAAVPALDYYYFGELSEVYGGCLDELCFYA